MANDYIPRPDAEFQSWQTNFVTYLSANLAGLGLVAGDLAPITAAQTVWVPAYNDHIAQQAAAQAAAQTKGFARGSFEGVIRPLVRRLQASASVDDAERASLGITVPDDGGPIGPPATRPLAAVDCGNRLQHIISFMDEATPTKKAKPAGVLGAEIWVKLDGPPPVDPSELDFLALDTRTPYTVDYPGTQGGKLAHYMLRWVSPTGEKGPWSETVSATITA